MSEAGVHGIVLDAEEQRVLGSLMEKQKTVPATYPLTANALKSACNQLNSREPVVSYDDKQIIGICHRLKERELIRVVAITGQRTLKYHQLLDERLDLVSEEHALLTVLLLRGPQSVGELKTRTERLHSFADRDAVSAVLQRMAGLASPLVRELERRHGEKETRWIHLLGPIEQLATQGRQAAPKVDREAVIADGATARDAQVRAAYDQMAEAYAATFADELAHKPFDRWFLDRVVIEADGDPVIDVGTGPGQVAAYLAAQGADASGQDYSAAMVALAQQRHPEITFTQGDLRQLMRPPGAAGWGAVTSFYSLVHFAASELPVAIGALARVLRPGGVLAIALHVGDQLHQAGEFLGNGTELTVVEHDPEDVCRVVAAAGLTDVEWFVRGPLPGTDEITNRLYLLARKPRS